MKGRTFRIPEQGIKRRREEENHSDREAEGTDVKSCRMEEGRRRREKGPCPLEEVGVSL